MNPVTRNAKQQVSILMFALVVSVTQLFGADKGGHIFIGREASAIEQYAARELQRYLYEVSGTLLPVETARPGSKLSGQAFVVGTARSNPLVARLEAEGQVRVSAADPGCRGMCSRRWGRCRARR